MPEGQQLRWWQDETATISPNVSERLLPSSAPMQETVASPNLESSTIPEAEIDTWAEIEAEALHRAEQSKSELAFYFNKEPAIRRYRWSSGVFRAFHSFSCFFFVCGIGILFYYLLTSSNREITSFLSLILWTVMGVFSFFCALPDKPHAAWLRHKESPLIRVTPQGLALDLLNRKHRDIAIPWSEIASVKACRLFTYRYLEIKTTKKRQFIVEERDLTVPVEEVANRILAYKATII